MSNNPKNDIDEWAVKDHRSALNDLITGALQGRIVVGVVEKAIRELAVLYQEIDHYDKVCTEVRNELADAGIPELTEDRLTVLPLAKRVSLLRAREQVVTAKLYTEQARSAKAKKMIIKYAETDAVYGIQPPKDLLSWLNGNE